MAPRRFFSAAKKSAHGVDGGLQPGTPVSDVAARDVHGLEQAAQLGESRPVESPLLTVAEAAAWLRIPVKSVYDHVYQNGLPIRRMGRGRTIRIHKGELDAWTRRHREEKPQGLRILAARRR